MDINHFKNNILPLREQLFRYAQKILTDPVEAEDIVQEVFLKAWQMRFELDRYDNIQGLLVKMTKNRCLNQIKSSQQSTFQTNEYPLVITDNSTPYSQLEQKDNVDQVFKIIDQLPTLQQTIIQMKHIDGYEIDEIVQITGSSPEAVRMNLSRARKRIKEMILKAETK